MANQNQNQNLNRLLDQSFQKKSAMEQGQMSPGATAPNMAMGVKPTKVSSGGGGLLVKILLAVAFILIIGLGAVGFMFYSDLDNKNTDQDDMITVNQDAINQLISRVDVIESGLSEIDTFTQKVEAIEEQLQNYATKEDLLPVMEFLKKQDSDQDGLSDYDEIVLYKSNPNKKDSDNDGYDDKAEVDSGYNPAGPGKLDEQELTEEEIKLITGDWSGSMSSEVIKSSEYTMNLSQDNKTNGNLVFPGATQNITYKSRVTGSYTFDKDSSNFSAILVNYFSVVNNSDNTATVTEKEYKMNLTGKFSSETKQLNGSWSIDGSVPANWPAANSGTFTLTKLTQDTSNNLDGGDTDTDTGDTTTPAQTVSVKAFSFGFSPATIKLIVGQRVTLELTSLDVAHTLTVNDLGIDMKVQGGETTSIEFTPEEAGEYEYYCSVPGHKEAGMVGTLIVEEAK